MLKNLIIATSVVALSTLAVYVHRTLKPRPANKQPIPFSPRLNKLHFFIQIAHEVLTDVVEASQEKNGESGQAYALLPLLRDVKKQGDALILKRKFYHSCLFPAAENKLVAQVEAMNHVEILLKSLARQKAHKNTPISPFEFEKAG